MPSPHFSVPVGHSCIGAGHDGMVYLHAVVPGEVEQSIAQEYSSSPFSQM